MSGLKKLAGQTAIYGMSSIIGRFLNYLLVPLYVRKFTPDQYGIVTEFYAYVVVLQILLTYGMETGFFRFSEKNYEKDTVFSTVLFSLISTSTFFILLVILFSGDISHLLGYDNHTDYVLIFAFILGIDAVTAIFFAKLRRENKAVKFAVFKIINISVNIGLNLFFILLCPFLLENGHDFVLKFYNPDYGVGYIFVSNLVASLVVFILFIPDLLKIKLKFDFKLWKSILVYSLPLLLTGLTGSVNEMADRILLKYWTVVPQGIADAHDYVMYQVGIYGANAKLAVIMMLFVQAFRYAAEPFFFSKIKDKNASLKIFADVMKYYVIFAILMFLLVLNNIDIFKYILQKDYWEGLDVVFPLFLSRFLVGVFFILSFWYKLNDLTKYGIVIFSVGAIVTVVMDYFMIPLYGYNGAAWTNFTAYLVMVLISYFWSRKYMPVNYQYFRIFLYIFAGIALYLISTKINTGSFFIDLILKNSLILFYVVLFMTLEKLKLTEILSLIPNLKRNASKSSK